MWLLGLAAVAGSLVVHVDDLQPSDAWNWPVEGRVSSLPGARWGRAHQGIDLAAPVGEPVFAARAGTVVFAGERGGYGLLVELEHRDGVRSRYAHLSRISVEVGQSLGGLETLGLVGQSGNATGPHLHFEILELGGAVDPRTVLR